MVMGVLTQVATGIQFGGVLTNSKRLEDSVRAGGNNMMTAMFQGAQMAYTIEISNRALSHANVGYIPFPLRFIVGLSPALLAFINYMGVENDTTRDVVVFLQANIGTFCQVAATVSAVALIFFGQTIAGGVTLGFLGLGYLDRAGYLPERMRHIIHEYTSPVLIATGLIVGGPVDIFFSLLNLAAFVANQYFQYKMQQQLDALNQANPGAEQARLASFEAAQRKDAQLIQQEQGLLVEMDPALRQGPLTVDLLKAHLEGVDGVNLAQVDWHHYEFMTRPAAPNIDFEIMNGLFDQIDFDRPVARPVAEDNKMSGQNPKKPPEHSLNIDVLRRKCQKDERFIKAHGKEEVTRSKPDQFFIDYARDNLKTCLHQIKTRHIPDGEPKNYDEIIEMLKIIADVLDKKAPQARVDSLLTLAVEGGKYCGPGKYEVIERVYSGLVLAAGFCPTRKKILNILQDARTEIVKNMYAMIPHIYGLVSQLSKKTMEDQELNADLIGWVGTRALYWMSQFYTQVIDWNDKHVFNQVVQAYGAHFGIRKTSADNDAASAADPAFQMILTQLSKLASKELWSKLYTTEVIERVLMGGEEPPAHTNPFYQMTQELEAEIKGEAYDRWEAASQAMNAPRVKVAGVIGTEVLPRSEISDYLQIWVERQRTTDGMVDIRERRRLQDEAVPAIRALIAQHQMSVDKLSTANIPDEEVERNEAHPLLFREHPFVQAVEESLGFALNRELLIEVVRGFTDPRTAQNPELLRDRLIRTKIKMEIQQGMLFDTPIEVEAEDSTARNRKMEIAPKIVQAILYDIGVYGQPPEHEQNLLVQAGQAVGGALGLAQ